ncbi:MAG: cytochrome o ubiquinol oxidase subunit III [Pseudomonadota bacterium]
MNAHVKEHEDDAIRSADFGVWVYLMTDAIIFALLFATYVVLSNNTAAGPGGAELFDLGHTALETGALLLSSLAYGFASIAMAQDNRHGVILWLLIAVALGLGFLGLEISEFAGMIAQGAGPDVSGFLSAFFTLVGTHGLHVTFGAIGIFVMIGQVLTKGLTPPVRSRIFRLGLFWHFLDIVWIGIFSIVYLPAFL